MPFKPSPAFWRFAFWLLALTIAALSLLPRDQAIPVGNFDKIAHFAAYAALAAAGTLGARSSAEMLGLALFAMALGGGLELLQAYVPGRSPGLVDFLADGLGVLAGGAAALAPPLRHIACRNGPTRAGQQRPY